MLLVSMIPTVIVAYLVSPIVEMLTGNLLASGLGLFVDGSAPVCVVLYAFQ